jgi:hypothetical protein
MQVRDPLPEFTGAQANGHRMLIVAVAYARESSRTVCLSDEVIKKGPNGVPYMRQPPQGQGLYPHTRRRSDPSVSWVES